MKVPTRFSPSQILLYRSCSFKYYLKYLLCVETPEMHAYVTQGSNVHDMIAKGNFESDELETQLHLNVARDFIRSVNDVPIFETEFDDPDNPCVFRGDVLGHNFMAIFDVFWKENAIGADWKLSKFKEYMRPNFEIQSYILNQLFFQKYGYYLKSFSFVFLRDGTIYEAKNINNKAAKKRTEKMIQRALDSIHNLDFKKRDNYACQYCEYNEICENYCEVEL